MLTGQNGILTQAQKAKMTTEQSAEQEKVQIVVAGSRNDNGILSYEKLKEEIENQNGTVLGDSIPTTIEINGNFYRVSETGNVTKSILGGTLDTVTGTETTNTTVQDALGNQIVVPAGFKIVNTKDYVTDGIIIEDVSYKATKGSQFVWIPVGDVKTADEGTINIELNRYTFDEDGTPIAQNQNIIDNKYTEINVSTYGNTTAKENIESEETGFRKSAKDNHGYYIGRYEARINTPRTSKTSDDKLTQITIKPDDYVYNYVTQPQAAKLSRKMYSGTPFESDLINSYAWNTATLFLQTFDNRTLANKKVYSKQNSLNDRLASHGTNKLESDKQDLICNVWDMASNCWEWTTETCNYIGYPCAHQGGVYDISGGNSSVSFRDNNSTAFNGSGFSFRPILYL